MQPTEILLLLGFKQIEETQEQQQNPQETQNGQSATDTEQAVISEEVFAEKTPEPEQKTVENTDVSSESALGSEKEEEQAPPKKYLLFQHEALDFIIKIAEDETSLSDVPAAIWNFAYKQGTKEGEKTGYDKGLKMGRKYNQMEVQKAIGIK